MRYESYHGGISAAGNSRLMIVCLQEDPAAILDIKQDIRDECSKIGDVTNVVLYDKEPAGVVTVRFSDPDAAKQCVKVSEDHVVSSWHNYS